jgi:hypothetical protein
MRLLEAIVDVNHRAVAGDGAPGWTAWSQRRSAVPQPGGLTENSPAFQRRAMLGLSLPGRSCGAKTVGLSDVGVPAPAFDPPPLQLWKKTG